MNAAIAEVRRAGEKLSRTLFNRFARLRAAHLRLAVASVWIVHGIYNKLLHGSPRHLQIVQAVPGLSGATGEFALLAIGFGEILLAAWMLSGKALLPCVIVQTAALLTMNVMELTWARQHLIWPAGLLPANMLLLAVAWCAVVLDRDERQTNGTRRASALSRLKRHPFAVEAHFDDCLVLTYALPAEHLGNLLPPGLQLDVYDGKWAFLAIALVRTRSLRPAGWPRWLGQDFFLTGYRVFARFRAAGGHPNGLRTTRRLRGLRILRSDADRRRMVYVGNLFTHYNYRLCRAEMTRDGNLLNAVILTSDRKADLNVTIDLSAPSALPAGSPFRSERDARRFAGPLPWTFDYEAETDSLIAIKGVRKRWNPRLVAVREASSAFLNSGPWAGANPILASAFYVNDVDYRWNRGVRLPACSARFS